jgi:fatty-acyl-CoA synthase
MRVTGQPARRRKRVDGLMMDVPLSLPALLRRTDTFFGHKEIITRRADRTIERRTYAECLQRARRLASGLASLGVRAGDRVATFCWNHSRHLEAYYGVPASGAVLHTLNIRLHPDELAYIISHAGDSVIVVDTALWRAFAPVRERIANLPIVTIGEVPDGVEGTIDYEEVVARGEDKPFSDCDERAAAVMCYTSGTTGRPKGVLYSHRAMVLHSMAAALPDCMSLRETDTVLAVVPMFHANAWGLPFICAFLGCEQVLPGAHLDPASIVELLESERVTFTAGVPTIWHGLLKYLDEHPGHNLSSIHTMLVGGAAIPEATVRAFETRNCRMHLPIGSTRGESRKADRRHWWRSARAAKTASSRGTTPRWASSKCAAPGSPRLTTRETKRSIAGRTMGGSAPATSSRLRPAGA